MRFRVSEFRWRSDHWLLLLAPVVALLTGVVVGGVSPVIGMGLVVGLRGAVVLIARPDWAWILTLLLVSQAIPGTLVPEVPVGFARLKVYELTFLLGFLGTFAGRSGPSDSTLDKQVSRGRWTSVFLLAVIVGSAVYSRLYLGNKEFVLAESRPYLALLSFGYVPVLLSNPKMWQTMDRSVVLSGFLLSAIVIVQLLTGLRILDARVEDLGLSANTGITRSITDTGTLVQAYAIYRLSQLSANRSSLRLFAVVGLAICTVGLLGTFTRGAWVATAAGAAVAAFVSGGLKQSAKVGLLGLVFVLLTGAGLYVVRPAIAEAMLDRALSVNSELESGASFGWRKLENEQAWNSIEKRPILGVGIGGAYKAEVKMAAGFQNDEYFIHSGYLYFPLKLGIPGLAILIWMLVQLLKLLVRHERGNLMHATQAGAVVVILLTNISGPVLERFLPILLWSAFVCTRSVVQASGKDIRAV